MNNGWILGHIRAGFRNDNFVSVRAYDQGLRTSGEPHCHHIYTRGMRHSSPEDYLLAIFDPNPIPLNFSYIGGSKLNLSGSAILRRPFTDKILDIHSGNLPQAIQLISRISLTLSLGW